MTNYEAIKKHPKEFEEWVRSKGGLNWENVYAQILYDLVDCGECPICNECEGMECLTEMRKLLNEEYRGADDERND